MIIFRRTNNNVNEFAEKNIDPNIVPTVGMTFKDVDDAYKFYKMCAYEVGFPLKKYREKVEEHQNQMIHLG
jgi:nitrate reductase beta subunit